MQVGERARCGFSVVEAVVLLGLSSAILVAILGMACQSGRGDHRNAELAPLELALEDELDRLIQLPFDTLGSRPDAVCAAAGWRSRVVVVEEGLVRVEVEPCDPRSAPLRVARLVARAGVFHAARATAPRDQREVR